MTFETNKKETIETYKSKEVTEMLDIDELSTSFEAKQQTDEDKSTTESTRANASKQNPTPLSYRTQSQDERKARTRVLINMGGLVSKAGLEPLKSDALYGALLSLKNEFTKRSKEEVFELLDNWTLIGRKAFEAEKVQGTAISIKFKSMPPRKIIDALKENGLKWNAYRKEWEGVACNIEALELSIKGSEYSIETLE